MLKRSLAIAFFVSLCAALPAQAGTRIALLPLSVHASGEDSAYLQTGLGEMIAARLDQYEGVTVVRPRVDGVPAGQSQTARAAAEGVDADFVLYGSFTRFGDGASLDLRCLHAAAPAEDEPDKARRVFIQAGELAEIIPQLDTLAQKVARYALRTGKPTLAAANDDKQPSAAPAPTAAQYDALLQRVEKLERAAIPPVAGAAEDESAGVR